MQISEVMGRTGLSRKAIYLYEEKGLLQPEKIPVGEVRAYREYTEHDVERLELIAMLRQLDLPLMDIEKILSGDRLDIILHNHFQRQQEKLTELRLTMDKLSQTLGMLPPNAGRSGLYHILRTVLPGKTDAPLRHKLDTDYSGSYTRRMAMLLYEAFLDKPLLTKEQFDAWYQLLADLEETITPEILDNYGEFYGRLNTEQLCEDYALRRRFVCGYTSYSPADEQAKAAEIVQELQALAHDPLLLTRWRNFYEKIVLAPLGIKVGTQPFHILSDVYFAYEACFKHMSKHFLTPALSTPEGNLLQKEIVYKMDGRDMFCFRGLIYFDFYNNTLRRMLYNS